MTSVKKILTNKNNAKKSTGPKSVAGKIRSSLNSIKHSLTSEKYVAIGENKKEFEELKQNALKQFPIFDLQSEIIVRQIIKYEWESRRMSAFETGILGRESLDYERSQIDNLKSYYISSDDLTNNNQITLSKSVELPAIAFLRDSNAGNAFLKVNTMDGRINSRLRQAIKDYEDYTNRRKK